MFSLKGRGLSVAFRADLRADIRAALNTPPTLQRQAIELSYFGGLSSQEIAQRFVEPVYHQKVGYVPVSKSYASRSATG